MAKGRQGRHRRIGCTLENCGVKRHSEPPIVPTPSFWDQDLMLNPYKKFSQMICEHRQSPNCLRQRCLEQRRIPYEVR